MNEQEKTARNEARIAAARRGLRQAVAKAVKGERGAGHDTASGSRSEAAAEGRGTPSGQAAEAGQFSESHTISRSALKTVRDEDPAKTRGKIL